MPDPHPPRPRHPSRRHAAARLCLGCAILLALAGCAPQRGADTTSSPDAGAGTADEPALRTTAAADPPAAPAGSTDAQIQQARELADAGLTDAALDLLTKAIERNPTLTTAHLSMGEIYERRGDFGSAERAFAQAARVEPTNFDAQYKHGFALHMLDRLTDAIRAYLRALAIRPDDFEANLNIATAYLELGEPNQALAFADKAATIKPQSGPARANLGAALGELADARVRAGELVDADRQYREAVRQFEAAAEYMEPTPELLLNLANTLGKIDRFQEMEATLDRLVRTTPTAPAYERLGFARFRQGDLTGAERAFGSALELDPRHYPAINGLAVCHLNTWHNSRFTATAARDEALTLLRRSLSVNPGQPRISELINTYSKN